MIRNQYPRRWQQRREWLNIDVRGDMTTPDLAAEPTIRAAAQLNQAARKPVGLRKKLLLVVPLPVGGYFLMQGLALMGGSQGDPVAELATGLVRGLHFLGALSCFYLSLRAFFSIVRSRQE
ncbi:MAG: hypothetical protein C5B51_13085 [Terriglobia bacterium]|nr:MAG: hypothetical protein C5B51_13085 [Terriglobia bacterium]